MLNPRTISVVAWDLDNTLFDRDAALFRFFAWYLARLDRHSPERGGPALLEAIMALDVGGDSDRLAFCRQVLVLLGHNPETAGHFWEVMRRKLPEFVLPEKGVAACLTRLRGCYLLAIISNGGGTLQRAKMYRAGVARYFAPEHVFISGEVGFDKPDPRFFETALRTLDRQPEQVLYVGDHPTKDIAGAAAVGMQTCWVSRGQSAPPGLRSDAVIATPWRLLPLLR